MTLSKLSPDDRPLAAKLLADYWAKRGMGKYDIDWAQKYLIEGHRKEIEQDDFFVFREKGVIVGVVSLVTYSSNVAEIRDLVVRPEGRGKGHGRGIITALIGLAGERGIRKLYALTFPGSESLFLSAGFQREGLLRDHFAKGEDMLFMGMTL